MILTLNPYRKKSEGEKKKKSVLKVNYFESESVIFPLMGSGYGASQDRENVGV